ncbi:hypothetical protein ACUOBA_16710, partial [Escherichia coli]
MISLKAPHNNLMPYTQQSILNTVKNNQLPEDIKSSLVSCVDIFKVLIKQYYDYPYDCRDDLVDDDKLIHLMAAVLSMLCCVYGIKLLCGAFNDIIAIS